MLLYHGTSAKRYKKIRKEGLHPWSTRVPDNYFVDVEAEKNKWTNYKDD